MSANGGVSCWTFETQVVGGGEDDNRARKREHKDTAALAKCGDYRQRRRRCETVWVRVEVAGKLGGQAGNRGRGVGRDGWWKHGHGKHTRGDGKKSQSCSGLKRAASKCARACVFECVGKEQCGCVVVGVAVVVVLCSELAHMRVGRTCVWVCVLLF